jgi:hypothetical protein
MLDDVGSVIPEEIGEAKRDGGLVDIVLIKGIRVNYVGKLNQATGGALKEIEGN